MQASPKGETLYKEPLTRSVEATYQGSELKRMVDSGALQVKSKYPTLSTIGLVAYGGYTQRKIAFSTAKHSPIPNSQLNCMVSKDQKYISIKWSF